MNTPISKHFLTAERAGGVSDLMAKPWQYLTPKVVPLFSGQHRDCCTGMELSEKLLYTAIIEAVVNCCNNTSAHTKYTGKALRVLKSLTSTYRDQHLYGFLYKELG